MIYYLTLQFEDRYSDETLAKMVGDSPDALMILQQTREMSPEERWDQLYLDAEFKCVGITNSITKQDLLNRIMGFMKITGASPVLSALTDMRVIMRMVTQSMTLPKEVLVANADQIMAQVQQAQIGAIVNPQPPPGQPQQGQPGPVQGMPGMNQFNSQEALNADVRNAPREQIPQ
jgi:hypothetical protein